MTIRFAMKILMKKKAAPLFLALSLILASAPANALTICRDEIGKTPSGKIFPAYEKITTRNCFELEYRNEHASKIVKVTDPSGHADHVTYYLAKDGLSDKDSPFMKVCQEAGYTRMEAHRISAGVKEEQISWGSRFHFPDTPAFQKAYFIEVTPALPKRTGYILSLFCTK
jgi:hypothetical protein